MDLEPPLNKNQSSDPLFSNESDHSSSDDEDPYSFTSTSTSLIGLAIVFVMLGIPLIAVINERPEPKKITISTPIDQNGPESSATFPLPWFSKSSC